MEDKKRRRKRLLNIAKILVSLGLLALILIRVDVGQTVDRLADVRLLPFFVAMALTVAGVLVRAYRWGALAWALDTQVKWRRLVELYFVGLFFNLVLPTGVGGDAVRIYELSQDGRASAAISSVLVDRFLGLVTLFGMAAVVLAGSYALVPGEMRWLIAIVVVGSLVAVALVLQRTWMEAAARRLGPVRWLGRVKILRELYASLHLYGRSALLRATAAALLFNLILVFENYLLGKAVGIDLSLGYYFLFVPIIAASLMVPSIGGLGVREGAYVFLFGQAGVDHDHGLALALVRDSLILFLGLIGAIIYVWRSVSESRRRGGQSAAH